MLRLSLLVILLTHSIRTAQVTDSPNVYDNLVRKLEKLNPSTKESVESPHEKLYKKLDRLNLLEPELSEEDEELISAMQVWLNSEQIDGVVKDLQRMKVDKQDSEQDYTEADWSDEEGEAEGDYPMNDDWDTDDFAEPNLQGTAKPLLMGVTPSAIIKPVNNVVSAAALIAATEARPRIIEEPNMSQQERRKLTRAVMRSTTDVINASKCLVPQARWITVRQVAPAADTTYTPPCVQLHRCAPDAGCCVRDNEMCAPVEGNYVILPFFLHKAASSMKAVKMQFYNHTRCACVSRETLQSTMNARRNTELASPSYTDSREDVQMRREMDRQNDWRVPTEEPPLDKEEEEEVTEPPQLRRCTCPGLFLASTTDKIPCSCVCDWPDSGRRRDCQSLAKGKEHFGLRDRVCVQRGVCTPPSCEYGAYDRSTGRCPLRRFRKVRYHNRGRYHEKTYSV